MTTSLQTRSRSYAMATLCLTQLMVILDGTIVNVALPRISTDLGFSTSGLSWVVNGFFVAFAGLLLVAGRLGDLLGARRVLLAGLVVFTAASLWCGVASTPTALVLGRFVQGAGGAFASAVVLGMIVALHPEPAARARAFAVFAFVGSAGASLGVLGGGVLTQALSWHWIFLVNLPVGAVAVVGVLRTLPDDGGAGLGDGVDLPGAVLGTATLVAAVAGTTQVADRGWLAPGSGGLLVVAVVLGAGFLLRESRTRTPLVPLRVFTVPTFALGNAVLFTMTVAGFSFQFLSALYLQQVLGLDPLATGLGYLTVTLSIAVSALFLSARLSAAYGETWVLVAGLLVFVTGMLLLARAPVDGSYVADVAPAMLLLGVGFGLAMPPATSLPMGAAEPSLAGVASGIVTTTQQVGGALGLGVVATVAAGRIHALGGSGVPGAVAAGTGTGLLVAAGSLVVGLLLAVALHRRESRT